MRYTRSSECRAVPYSACCTKKFREVDLRWSGSVSPFVSRTIRFGYSCWHRASNHQGRQGKARQGNPGHNEYNISNACIHTHTSANEIHLPLSQKVRNVLYCIALHWIALRCTEATPLGARKDRTNEHHALCRKVRSKEHNQAMASLCGQLASFIHSLFRFGSV